MLSSGLSPLYPILDDAYLSRAPQARAALLGALAHGLQTAGVTMLQYRNKRGSDAEVLDDSVALRAHTTMRLILNDRVDLVAEARFDGVHIGQGDASPRAARALIGEGKILGLSTHNEAQVLAAAETAADYLAIGPIFATATKVGPDPVVGLEGLRRARGLTSKPLVAIGGITLANAASVRQAGADAIAVISALFPGAGRDHESIHESVCESICESICESAMKIAKDFLAVFQ